MSSSSSKPSLSLYSGIRTLLFLGIKCSKMPSSEDESLPLDHISPVYGYAFKYSSSSKKALNIYAIYGGVPNSSPCSLFRNLLPSALYLASITSIFNYNILFILSSMSFQPFVVLGIYMFLRYSAIDFGFLRLNF